MTTSTRFYPFTYTNETITVIVEGKPVSVQRGSVQFNGLREALFREDWQAVERHLSPAASLQQWTGDKFVVDGLRIMSDGVDLPKAIVDRIWAMANAGESPAPMFAFWERLSMNPSYRSVQQLYSFLEHTHIPLEADGTFLTYKAINADLRDMRTNTINNAPGSVNEMPRNQISDDHDVACDAGYHVGALGYVRSFADHNSKIVICRVDPADVVSVPRDEQAQKIRVCRYEVIGYWSGQPMPSTTMKVESLEDDEDEDDDEIDDVDIDLDDEDDDEELSEIEKEEIERDMEEVAYDIEREKKHKPVKAKSTSTRSKPSRHKLARMNKLDSRALMECSIDELRTYATKLKIVGASKLPGGKTALVGQIVNVRRRKK